MFLCLKNNRLYVLQKKPHHCGSSYIYYVSLHALESVVTFLGIHFRLKGTVIRSLNLLSGVRQDYHPYVTATIVRQCQYPLAQRPVERLATERSRTVILHRERLPHMVIPARILL